ncbi:MAG: hypothetical protein EBS23_00855 [Betaproteobacteria bacterium]|nr:hypothetical protein [Betaproteobacteria bacterium]
MMFRCQIVENRDDDGRATCLGARWTEARPVCEALCHGMGTCVFVVAVMIGIGSLLLVGLGPEPVLAGLGIAALLYGVAYGLFWIGWRVPGRVRELTFWREGATVAPTGLSTVKLRHGTLHLPHSDILSIEAEQCLKPKGDDATIYTHGVQIFYGSGHVVHIADKLAPDQAHMLAVSLTTALAELRQDMGITARGGSAAPRLKAEERVID